MTTACHDVGTTYFIDVLAPMPWCCWFLNIYAVIDQATHFPPERTHWLRDSLTLSQCCATLNSH